MRGGAGGLLACVVLQQCVLLTGEKGIRGHSMSLCSLMGGAAPAGRCRRGETFQLGPLLQRRPLFMEMACSGLVRGAPGRLIGIVG